MLSHLKGCNSARRYCEDDKMCREALHYYEMVCEHSQGEFSAPHDHCPTLHCLESYEILMRQTQAQFLRGCLCEVITPHPNVVYCFQEDFFTRCSVAQLDRDARLMQGLALNKSPRQGSVLFSVPAIFFLCKFFFNRGD
jgi:hypothetical protein